MITVLLNDAGDKIQLDADPADVNIESGALVVKRDRKVIARLRRHIGYWESTSDD